MVPFRQSRRLRGPRRLVALLAVLSVAVLLVGPGGLVGAVTAWALQTGNLFGLSTDPLARLGAGFGFVGATLGLFYWPVIGAGVCFAFAVYFTSRRFA